MLALVLLATAPTVISPTPVAAAPSRLPKAPAEKVIPHTDFVSPAHRATPVRVDPPRGATTWPAAGSAEVVLGTDQPTGAAEPTNAAERGARVPTPRQAGSLPVKVASGATARAAKPGLHVEVADRSVAERAGVRGVLLGLRPTSGDLDSTTVSIDYSSFRFAGGADLGSRLRLVRLPECALSTPEKPACQVQSDIAATNDQAAQSVTTVLPVSANKMTVLAATAGASGPNGSFSASSLSPTGSWAVSGNTGGFTWSYPIPLPPTATGESALPDVTLAYSSARVDGRTSATNNQSSWIGQGWDYSPGFIERTYRACGEDTTLPQAQRTGDLCWAGQIVTMSLGGRSTALIRNDADGSWRPAADDGTRVELLTGVANGARNGEHWRITTTDGTQYYFGRNDGPGRTTQDTTNSTWTVPVYGPRSADPCYNAAGFAQSQCNQAWRWNLDYVEDPHGNAALYYYTPETNYYGANTGTTGVQYTRGGTLKRIDYGLRKTAGSVYGATVPGQVAFDVTERCTPSGAITCAPAQFTAANAASWPDTPQDQQCLSGATCNNHSPSFWSTKRLTTITTQYNTGAGPIKVDSYALTQTFPSIGDPELRLDQLVRTAWESGTTATSMPPLVFTSQLLDNRVSGYNGQPAMAHWRVTNVATGFGGQVAVTYLPAECTSTTVPTDLPNNTKRCYPVYWTLPLNQNPTLDFFHIYPVSRVESQDSNGLTPTQRTDYSYLGTPAWHYDDNELVKPANRTYGQFRGYGQVETRTGNPGNLIDGVPDAQTLSNTTYFRGMNGDTLPGNQQRSVTVTNSLGEVRADDNLFAGSAFETQNYLGSGGARLGSSIIERTKLATTATRARTGLPAATADIVVTTRTRAITDLAAGGVRTATSTNRHDTLGRVVSTSETADGVPDKCSTSTYADNTTSWIRDKTAETWSSAAACPTTGPVTAPAPIVSAQRVYYDGQSTLGTVAGAGDATRTDTATANTSGNLTFTTTATAAFDASGRPVSQKDALTQETKTAYTPADGGIVSQVVTTNPKNQTSSATLEPSHGMTTKAVDVGGRVTEATYDSFGRTTAVWNPGRVKPAGSNPGDTPNSTYSYLVRDNGPLAVTARKLVDYGTGTNYVTAITLFDAAGKPRQTQSDDISNPAGVSNRIVTETFYDSHGWPVKAHNRYVTTGVPSTTMVTVPDASVDDRSVSGYDGSGRVVRAVSYQGLTPKATTTTVYGGDRVTTFPPTGGVTRAQVTDARGNTVERREYTTQPTVTGNVVSGGTARVSTFEYNALNQLIRNTDAAGTKWEYQYDFLGRQTGATDPDAGQTTRAYDLAGQISSSTDARGQVLSYDYDVLGRRTAEYSGVGAGRVKLASWAFDTATAGVGKLASTTRYTTAGNYSEGVSGYNAVGLPTNNVVQIPAAETGLNGLYTTTYSYTTTGLLTGMTPPTKGGLPGEAMTFVVDKYGNQTETRSNVWDYVSGSTYTASGEPAQFQLSSGNNAATLTFERDPRTHVVDHTNLSVQAATPLVDDLRYTYDPAGNLTKVVNARPGGTRTQCFGYDSLDRLSQAWTATDSCAGQPSTAPGATTVGGPDPYWTSWTFSTVGLRTGQTKHGIGQADTTTGYTYPSPTGTRPHSLSATATTGPGGSSSTSYTYDNAGNTTNRTLAGSSHTLTWTETGSLAKVQSPTGDTTYVYDADGMQLLRREPGKVILYLPGQEFARDTATGTITGTRYYSHNGTLVARRVGSANPEYLSSDHHGTTQVSVSAVGFAVTRREADPYGNPVGAVQGGPWADNRGFLGMPTNAATGLVDIGARKYDTTTGKFISVDPVLNLQDPGSWTGYTYANDNPTTFADPTGEFCDGCATNNPNSVAAKSAGCAIYGETGVCPTAAVEKRTKELLNGTGDPNKQPIIFGHRLPTAAEMKKGMFLSGPVPMAPGETYQQAVVHWASYLCNNDMAGPGPFCEWSYRIGNHRPDGWDLLFTALNAWMLAEGVRVRAPELEVEGRTRTGIAAAADKQLLSTLENPGAFCSFTGDTAVLMGDGSSKPIKDVVPGDVVLATDPETGQAGPRKVQATWPHADLSYELAFTDGTTIQVTEDHPFWNATDKRWERADALDAGDLLASPTGSALRVAGIRPHSARLAEVYNLTVADLHTFYVFAGATPVLVHNTCKDGVTYIFRSPGEGNKAAELKGLNAANHKGDHPTAYLSNKAGGAAQYAGIGHDDGFYIYKMKPGFQERFGKYEYPLENSNGLEDVTEYRISSNDFDEFNSYIDGEGTWVDSHQNWYVLPPGVPD
ncbi:polymorphic toxin-type HINT domain-containing protein [Actinokineospora diospyrosa]|uniref:polymorphic toxin-type HINT domain-containing protein n=1 Tax=Actinokineospora diospyrosa TaxID=103728 RepID=UPI0020A5158B|nr:polymorphic toxin-type HINT domain-containing protein [Actinokineospora diospyrosa]